jgi:hypothetical protein
MQHTRHVMMIEPVRFAFNAQTAANNYFQQSADQEQEAIAEKANKEFQQLVDVLRQHQIDVTVIPDTTDPHTPDSVFPNNWISTHEDGSIVLYPMYAPNRRLERKPHVLEQLKEKFIISREIDFSTAEEQNHFLEGTGSMVLDRENRIAYACISPRTDAGLLLQFCEKMQYEPFSFHAGDAQQRAIYHTNVMMCIADRYAVVCMESITDAAGKILLEKKLQDSGKEIIPISFEQMNHFAGNMLQVHNSTGERFMVMSSQAYHSLDAIQLKRISQYNPVLHADITTIETLGGGSARCMIAEIFLQEKQ